MIFEPVSKDLKIERLPPLKDALLLSSTSVGAIDSAWSVGFKTSAGERRPIELVQKERYLSEVQQMTVRRRRSAAIRQRAGNAK